MNHPLVLRALATLALAALLGSCAGSHGSLSSKTRWYRHHSSGSAVPCPCGH